MLVVGLGRNAVSAATRFSNLSLSSMLVRSPACRHAESDVPGDVDAALNGSLGIAPAVGSQSAPLTRSGSALAQSRLTGRRRTLACVHQLVLQRGAHQRRRTSTNRRRCSTCRQASQHLGSLTRTASPTSTISRLCGRPRSRSYGVLPSDVLWNRQIDQLACRMTHGSTA